MRYPADQKTQTREKLVRESAAVAKAGGFAASGIDALARAAGLTSGAFYRHFEGKDQLLAAICESELEATGGRFAQLTPGSTQEILRAVDTYLSLAHVRNPQAGCLLPSLSAEVARASEETRVAFERAFEELADVVTKLVGDRAVALGVVTQCVGAVTVARAFANEAAQREVLAAARKAVRGLLEDARCPE